MAAGIVNLVVGLVWAAIVYGWLYLFTRGVIFRFDDPNPKVRRQQYLGVAILCLMALLGVPGLWFMLRGILLLTGVLS